MSTFLHMPVLQWSSITDYIQSFIHSFNQWNIFVVGNACLPLFMALFWRERVVHVAWWYECQTTGEHCLRPATVQYLRLLPRNCRYHSTQQFIVLSSRHRQRARLAVTLMTLFAPLDNIDMKIFLIMHLRRTCTRWHFAFGLCCHTNETRDRLQIRPIMHN